MVDLCRMEETDLPMIERWAIEHKLDPEIAKDYGYDSFVAIHGKEFIAVSGIECAGSFGFIVGMMTNPKAEITVRSHAIDALTKKMIEIAKKKKMKKLIAWTEKDGIIKRSFDHGFSVIEQTMIGIGLKGD